MRNNKKTVVILLLSMLIFVSIGPFYGAYARRTLTINVDANDQNFGDVLEEYGAHAVYICKDISFIIEPNPGYHIHELLIDGELVPGFNPVYGAMDYTFTKVKENHLLYIVFEENADLDLPPGSEATISVAPEGDIQYLPGFEYLPGTFAGATPFTIEVIGSLSGTATIYIHYDDSVFGSEIDEEALRLYIGNPVDFTEDGTVNGNDVAAIQEAQRTELTPEELLKFDVNGDGVVDIIDENIVKEYANSGVVVSPGNYGGAGEFRVPWIDITTGIDTENNIIWGETWHLSLFRCR